MCAYPTSCCHSSTIGLIAAALAFPAASIFGQAPACPSITDRIVTPADTSYADGDYAAAETLYTQALAQRPQDHEVSAALVRTLLREGKIAQADSQANSGLALNPQSAIALTALAEVELRQGEPWLALQTLDRAEASDRCYARGHLVRSRAQRIDSMYASERAEIQRAYDIDPGDTDIMTAWQRIVSPAQEIESVTHSLATIKDIDPETRKTAENTVRSMMPLLSENSQTCKVLPTVEAANLPLLALMPDPKHIEGYRLAAQIAQSDVKLLLDTSASGIFITKALADANGFKHDPNAPDGTVQIDSVRIGPLLFRDCMAGVTDAPIPGKPDGFIGTDIFASYLVTLDFRLARMILSPLPPRPGIVPGDRISSPELADFVPVYHRRHYLLLPVEFNNKSRKLFVLATGMRSSAMTSEVAHSVSKITFSFTNSEQTATGGSIVYFRDIFDLQLPGLPVIHQGHILQFDSSIVDRNAGFQIAGMLGLDVLHSLTLHLDYRDGLVKMDTLEKDFAPLLGHSTSAPASAGQPSPAECPQLAARDIPISSTLVAKVIGTLDSAHLKPGKEIWVKDVNGWDSPDCRIEDGAILYGHVTAAATTKDQPSPELSLTFDHADCSGHAKKAMSFYLIGLVGPAGESRRLHDEIDSEVSGGARQIGGSGKGTDSASMIGVDDNLNPEGAPRTVHPGIVVRMPDLKLEPVAGPGCSARITGSNRNVELGTGSGLILLMRRTP